MVQLEFQFVFPYPAGCWHVSEDGVDGSSIDDCARVCGYACAIVWAKSHGRILIGQKRVYTKDGKTLIVETFATKKPSDVIKPSFAHLFASTRGDS